PASARPSLKAATRCAHSASDPGLRNPTTGIAACCARAASGHAAAPPMSVMNSRRLMAASFDHLVGGHEQPVRHGEAEHPGSLVIDDQFKFSRLHDRQVHRFGTLEDAAGIDADLLYCVPQVCPVTHQPAGVGKLTKGIDRGNCAVHRLE